MKKKAKKPTNRARIVRNVITFLAAVNLVLLFVFHYNVPGFSYLITQIENHRDHIDGVEGTVEADSNVTLEYEEETYVYKGDGAFDPTSDVTVKDQEGNELDHANLTASVSGDASKEIIYTYETEDGQYYGTETRPLQLDDYNGPVIVISADAPTITDNNLAKIAKKCKDIYTASDGYGNDITDQVTVIAVPDSAYDGTFKIMFSVTNQFGDTAQSEVTTKTRFEEPHMKLAEEEIYLERGSGFDPMAYVLYAVDADGSDLTALVETDGEVDTQAVGDYTVEYDLTNEDGQSVKTKELTVHVVNDVEEAMAEAAEATTQDETEATEAAEEKTEAETETTEAAEEKTEDETEEVTEATEEKTEAEE